MKRPFFLSLTLALLVAAPARAQEGDSMTTNPKSPIQNLKSETVPAWAHEAVFYQIFPERFRNGDPSNDPTYESLETPVEGRVPESWAVTPWTSDWYARAEWEKEMAPENFYGSVFDRRYGGDLQGVVDKLPYLDSLGVNAIYFNPVFYARSLHKYDGNSFHHIDPYFGPDPEGDFALMAEETSDPETWHVTAADSLFFALLEQAHARDIRVIIDGVFNHTGRDFFAFADLRENQEDSPYADWYIVESFDDPATPDTSEFAYEGWWGVETLPVFADNAAGDDLHPGPKQYVMDATEKWMDPNGDGDPADGIDGWRLDVTNEVPIGFWQDWNARVRELNPDAYTVTEIWEEASDFIEEGDFSATMNYYAFAFPAKGFLVDYELRPEAFGEMLNERRTAYDVPVRYALQNLFDSHDTDRLASMIVNAGREPYEEPERFDYDWGSRVSPRYTDAYLVRAPNEEERQIQRLAALFQMTYVGAPMLYYGTEAGMWGADDPDDRKPMLWPDLDYAPEAKDPLGRAREADTVAFDHDLFSFYRDIIALRNEHDAFQEGDFEVLSANESGLFVYRRATAQDTFIVALNRSNATQEMELALGDADAYQPIYATRDPGRLEVRVHEDGGRFQMALPPRTGLVIRRDAAGGSQGRSSR